MIAIISVIVILILSILITKVASIALTHTGLSKETAKFQARSAFTGVGFTTSESEKVVNNPVRRRILLLLMILGNAGIITALGSFLIGFIGVESDEKLWPRILVLAGSIVILLTIANSDWFDRRISNLINKFLKRYTRIDVNDYASLLHLSGEYSIAEMAVEEGHWLCDKRLKDSRLRAEGIIVLGISKADGSFIGVPQPETRIKKYDNLIIYGRAQTMYNLKKRSTGPSGTMEHVHQVEEQQEVVKKEKEDS